MALSLVEEHNHELVEIDLSSDIEALDEDIFISIASECYFKKGLSCFKMCYLVLKTFSTELNTILPDLNTFIEENDNEGIQSCIKHLFHLKEDLIEKIKTIEFIIDVTIQKVNLYFDSININDLNPLIHNTRFCKEMNTQFIFSGIHKDWILRMNKLFLKNNEFTQLTEAEMTRKKKKSIFGFTYSKPKAIEHVKTNKPNIQLVIKDTSVKIDETSSLVNNVSDEESKNRKTYTTFGLCVAATAATAVVALL